MTELTISNPTGDEAEGINGVTTNPNERISTGDVPHSGHVPIEEGGERPVDELPTSLEQDVKSGRFSSVTDRAVEKNGISRKWKITGGLSAITFLTMAIGTTLAFKPSNEAPDGRPAEASAPVNPGQSEPEATQPETGPEPADASMEQLDAMTPSEFSSHSLSNRLEWVVVKYKEVNDKGLFYNSCLRAPMNNEGLQLLHLSPLIQPQTAAASAESIVNGRIYAEQMAMCWQENEADIADGPIDTNTASKFVSSMYLDNKSPAFQDALRDFGTVTTAKLVGGYNDHTASDLKQLEPYTNKSLGLESAPHVSLRDTTDEVSQVKEFVFVAMDEQLGAGNGLWLESATRTIE